MKIISSEIQHLEIPLKTSFSHASKTRKKTDSTLVLMKSENGLVGVGEGCPRPYVTGETWESSRQFFESMRPKLERIHSIDTLQAFVRDYESEIDKNPAVWCAIELAILDLLGKEHKQTIEEVLELPTLTGEFQYSAVIGTKHMSVFYIQTLMYLCKGFTDFKIKIFGDLKNDRQKVQFLKFVIGKKLRLRLDANNLWNNTEDAVEHIKKLNGSFFALEEPVQPGAYKGLATIGKSIDTKLIVDESFLRLGQFKELETVSARWVINVRVSKMGGLIRSLQICEEARKRKIPVIIGAQVGETSILTRASLSLAHTYREILIAQEGAFGTYLLEQDVTEPSIQFGRNGIVKSSALVGKEKFGLGLFCTRGSDNN